MADPARRINHREPGEFGEGADITIERILADWDRERSAGLPPHERIEALSRASQNERASR